MPARTRPTWSGHKMSGPWHPAAHELAVLVMVELEYYRQQFLSVYLGKKDTSVAGHLP